MPTVSASTVRQSSPVRTAEELHFGRAAKTFAISQQALSKRIVRLESLLAGS